MVRQKVVLSKVYSKSLNSFQKVEYCMTLYSVPILNDDISITQGLAWW